MAVRFCTPLFALAPLPKLYRTPVNVQQQVGKFGLHQARFDSSFLQMLADGLRLVGKALYLLQVLSTKECNPSMIDDKMATHGTHGDSDQTTIPFRFAISFRLLCLDHPNDASPNETLDKSRRIHQEQDIQRAFIFCARRGDEAEFERDSTPAGIGEPASNKRVSGSYLNLFLLPWGVSTMALTPKGGSPMGEIWEKTFTEEYRQTSSS